MVQMFVRSVKYNEKHQSINVEINIWDWNSIFADINMKVWRIKKNCLQFRMWIIWDTWLPYKHYQHIDIAAESIQTLLCYGVIQYYNMINMMILLCDVRYYMGQFVTILYSTMLHCTALHFTIINCSVPERTVWED